MKLEKTKKVMGTYLWNRISSLILAILIAIGIVAVPGFSSNSLAATTGEQIVIEARRWIGVTPYVFGGTDLYNGADCSGWLCRIYEKFGIDLWPFRTNLAGNVDSIGRNMGTDPSVAQPGDIISWYSHVGIAADSRTVIQCGESGTKELRYSDMGMEIYMIIRPNAISSNYHSGSSVPGEKWAPAKSFYAYIIRTDSWTKISSSSTSNVEITGLSHAESETDPSCIWRFVKKSNGSYVIYNAGSGKVLDAEGGIQPGDGWKNIITYGYHGGSNQLWDLYKTENGILIKNSTYDLILDCADNRSSGGTNIQAIRSTSGCIEAKTFSVYIIANKTTSFSNATVNVISNDGKKVFENSPIKEYEVYKYTEDYGSGYILKSKKQEKVLLCKAGAKTHTSFNRSLEQRFSIKKVTSSSGSKAVSNVGRNVVRSASDIFKQATNNQT